ALEKAKQPNPLVMMSRLRNAAARVLQWVELPGHVFTECPIWRAKEIRRKKCEYLSPSGKVTGVTPRLIERHTPFEKMHVRVLPTEVARTGDRIEISAMDRARGFVQELPCLIHDLEHLGISCEPVIPCKPEQHEGVRICLANRATDTAVGRK